MNPDRLDVFHGDLRVGSIHDRTPLAFEYAEAWLDRADAFTVGTIPLRRGVLQADSVDAYFENLLPEGELRQYLAEQRKASTVFSMLAAVAGDTAGAFVILPRGHRPERPVYRKTTWAGLARRLEGDAAAIDLAVKDARLSLSGAQDKALIAIFEDGEPWLPEGSAPSTHILKPDIRRLRKVWHSAANETIVMKTAALCGLGTAEAFYEARTSACIVRRFDRFGRPDGSLGRIVQYDLCQLAGTVSDKKYESEGGPGLAACADLIRNYSTEAALDLRRFIGWILFNLYVGNNDGHAKNLSIHHLEERGVVLTPFYDLMCTRVYPGLSPDFAFSVGGEVKPGSIGAKQIAQMASDIGVRPQFVLSEAADLASRIDEAIDAAVAWAKPGLPTSARPLAIRLRQFIKSNTRKTAARLLGAASR